MNKGFDFNINNTGCTFSLQADGLSDTFKFKITPAMLNTSTVLPDSAWVDIGNDQTGLGITATAAFETVGSDTFCTVTFNHVLPAADPTHDDPCIQAQVTFEYNSAA